MRETIFEAKLSVLLFHDAEIDAWVAQCIEFDIAAQGDSRDNALDALGEKLIFQVVDDAERGRKPLGQFRPAPQAIRGCCPNLSRGVLS